jgi:DICT domain-containing protein
MSIVIDPAFSVYGLVERSRQASIILAERRTMSLISHKIEKRLHKECVQGHLFAGFQRMSFFEKRRAIYEKLAEQVAHIYVFAYPDVPAPSIPNITFVPLKESDKLTDEWFLIFHGECYFTALVSEEQTELNATRREFDALWTFDLDIIEILTEWLMSAVDAKTDLPKSYDRAAQMKIMDSNVDDLLTAIKAEPQTQVQVKAVMDG